MTTKIEWTDETWNPTSGCSKVSTGCKHCYAERLFPWTYPGRDFTEVRLHADRLSKPLHWKKPRRVFVNSMSDLFHEDVHRDFILQVFRTMETSGRHSYQILTKRSERMRYLMTEWLRSAMTLAYPRNWHDLPLQNVWLGVSVENVATMYRIDHLRETPAAVRFLSLEPLLGDLGVLDLTGISWVIVGGESGPNARPMHPEWARSIRDQCVQFGVPFFFKQWGEWEPYIGGFGHEHIFEDGQAMRRAGKKVAGRLLDGEEWNEYPSL